MDFEVEAPIRVWEWYHAVLRFYIPKNDHKTNAL